MRKIIVVISILIILFLLKWIIAIGTVNIGKPYHFQTRTGDFEFVAVPSKGRDTDAMKRRIARYEAEHNTQITVYRTFKKNYLKFWEWDQYRNNPLYRYGYMKRTTDENRRFSNQN